MARTSMAFIFAAAQVKACCCPHPTPLAGLHAAAVANWIINTWLPLFVYERFHMRLANAGFCATFYIQAASYYAS